MTTCKNDSDLRSPVNQQPNLTEHLPSSKLNIKSDNGLQECFAKLQGLERNIQWSSKDTNTLLTALEKRFECQTRPGLFGPWAMDMLHSIEINHVKPDRQLKFNKTIAQLVSDNSITDNDLKNILSSETEKTLDEILKEIRQNELNQTDDELLDDIKDIVSTDHKEICSPKNCAKLDGLKKELFYLCEVVKETQKITPRLTQMVSWCLMALSESGWLIQVGTGEGKSCIVAMFAAFKSRRGYKVDVLSSSSVLADRDMTDWEKFYKKLGIKVDCNTSKSETEKKGCYNCDVVYGTAADFAGDWLRHGFQRQGIRGNRQFECVIVDEVDSLMLDKGLQMVYLSNEMAAMQHLNPLLALIWATVNQYLKIDSETTAGPVYPFIHVVFENIHEGENVDECTILQMAEDTGTIPKGCALEIKQDPSHLLEKIKGVTAKQVAEFLKVVETKYPSCHFALHCQKDECPLEEITASLSCGEHSRRQVPLLFFNDGFCRYLYTDKEKILRSAEERIKNMLRYTPSELSDNRDVCFVPRFLKDLVESKFTVWIRNAFHAQTMAQGHEYIVEGGGVVPVDYSCTGVVENYMKWSDGLQQFLEMRHLTRLSDISVITNYMSNVCLLKQYDTQLFGISGTLGQTSEIETVKRLYKGIRICHIPSFQPRKLFEEAGVIVDSVEEWIEKICSVVQSQTKPTAFRGGRAVLVICETINRAQTLCHALGPKVRNTTLYVNNNTDDSGIKKVLDAGDVIIATNLAGRGTDLRVRDRVKSAGGLFVVQTFLPMNVRVEQQAFGRSARQGAPGSAQLIICSQHFSEQLQVVFTMLQGVGPSGDTKITLAKNARDFLVSVKLSSFLDKDVPKILKKEELFAEYTMILEDLHATMTHLTDSVLTSLNETWGIWLLTNFNDSVSSEDLKLRLRENMQEARTKLELSNAPCSIIHHYTCLGNDLRKGKQFRESIAKYSKAIQEDHCWAAIAMYNRSLASLVQQNRNQDRNCISQAMTDLEAALKSVKFYQRQISITHVYAKLAAITELDETETRFDKHMRAKYLVFEFFKANITEAIQELQKATRIGGNVKVDTMLVYFMAPLWYLVPLEVFQEKRTLQTVLGSNEREKQHLLNHPAHDVLRELKALKCLGLTEIFTLDTAFSIGGFFRKLFN